MTTIPIFVSSTHRDFHWERDVLRRVVAPGLDAILADLGARVELVDLRWGVDTQSVATQVEREMRVLEVCLQEIDRSHPLFLGQLGAREGWAPDPALLASVAERLHLDVAGLHRFGEAPDTLISDVAADRAAEAPCARVSTRTRRQSGGRLGVHPCFAIERAAANEEAPNGAGAAVGRGCSDRRGDRRRASVPEPPQAFPRAGTTPRRRPSSAPSEEPLVCRRGPRRV